MYYAIIRTYLLPGEQYSGLNFFKYYYLINVITKYTYWLLSTRHTYIYFIHQTTIGLKMF